MSNKINELVNEILEKTYPIGSIYISTNNTNPATIFGGYWTQIKDRFLFGAGTNYTNGTIGGEATHTLTWSEMASHQHITHRWNIITSPGGNTGIGTHNGTGSNKSHNNLKDDGNPSKITGYTGGGQAHENMPPYLAVYMWKRVAEPESFIVTSTQRLDTQRMGVTISYVNYNTTKYVKDINSTVHEIPVGTGSIGFVIYANQSTIIIFNDSACTSQYTTISSH